MLFKQLVVLVIPRGKVQAYYWIEMLKEPARHDIGCIELRHAEFEGIFCGMLTSGRVESVRVGEVAQITDLKEAVQLNVEVLQIALCQREGGQNSPVQVAEDQVTGLCGSGSQRSSP